MEEITEGITVFREEQTPFVNMSQSGHNEKKRWKNG